MNSQMEGGRASLAGAVLALGLALVHAGADAGEINVPADFPTVQQAVDNAADGDVVVVADGLHAGGVTVNGKAITIRSASDDPEACQLVGGFVGVNITGVDAQVKLQSLLIRDASRGVEINASASAAIENCIVQDCASLGGIMMNGTTLRLRDSLVWFNQAGSTGAGLFLTAGNVTITNTTILNNTLTASGAQGAGLHVGPLVDLVMLDCRVNGNIAGADGDGQGGGLYASGGQSPLVITNTEFLLNQAGEEGGGLFIALRDARLGNVEIDQNTAGAGGGIWIENLVDTPHTVSMSNVLVTNNVATTGSGGGIRAAQTSVIEVTNATIFDNTAGSGGGVANGANCVARFTNCIVGMNAPTNIAGVGETFVEYSNILGGGFAGDGNISALPLFSGDYRLSPASPCIDAGSSASYWGPALDLDGAPRAADDPATDDTGLAAAGPAIDMGAFEFQPEEVVCAGDANGDGVVDVQDLVIVITSWGLCF